MPIKKSAKKALRKSLKRKARNLICKNKIKSLLKEIKNLVSQKKIEEVKRLLPQVYKLLDKAAKTGLIKKNTANRKKSRIARLLIKSQR
jgi:small subunit ribosomal protein S20